MLLIVVERADRQSSGATTTSSRSRRCQRLGIQTLIDTKPEVAVLTRQRAVETSGHPLCSDDAVALTHRTLRPQMRMM